MGKPEGDLLDKNLDLMLAAGDLAHELRYAVANGAKFNECIMQALDKYYTAQHARNAYIEATDIWLKGGAK